GLPAGPLRLPGHGPPLGSGTSYLQDVMPGPEGYRQSPRRDELRAKSAHGCRLLQPQDAGQITAPGPGHPARGVGSREPASHTLGLISARNAAWSYHQPRPPCASTTVRPGKSRKTSSSSAGSAKLLTDPEKVDVPQCTMTGNR